MPADPTVLLAGLDMGDVRVRAVRVAPSAEVRDALTAGGYEIGDEIVEVRWGEQPFGQPTLSERPSMIIGAAGRALVFGLLPPGAVSAEAVSPDGDRVPCTVGPGVWLVNLPDNELGAELYPVLFRDRDGATINPGLPADWEREPIGARDDPCPACGNDGWDLVTAAWQGTGWLRSTRWGNNPDGPGRAFVCRTCGHEQRLGHRVTMRRAARS